MLISYNAALLAANADVHLLKPQHPVVLLNIHLCDSVCILHVRFNVM